MDGADTNNRSNVSFKSVAFRLYIASMIDLSDDLITNYYYNFTWNIV